MAGRDLKLFLSHHRKSAKDDLVNSLISGSRRGKGFTDVDYDQLLNEVQTRKEHGNASIKKINKLVDKANESKEEKLLGEHKQAWTEMVRRLRKECEASQQQVDMWVVQATLAPQSSDFNDFLSEISAMEVEYRRSRESLSHDIHSNLRSIRIGVLDFSRRVSSGKRGRGNGSHPSDYASNIRVQIDLAKSKLAELQEALLVEGMELNESLKLVSHQYNTQTEVADSLLGGVVKELWSWECPSDDLRQKMADEFKEIDEHFINQLASLKDKFKKFMTIQCNTEWSEEDCIRYDLVMDQYNSPRLKSRRRLLCIDRLMREMPGKKRSEIVEYEECSCAEQYYRTQRAVLVSSWHKTRQGFCEEVKQIYREAMEKWRAKEAISMEIQQQRNLCDTLAKKVIEWRKHRLEAERQAAEDEAKRAAIMEEVRRNEETKQRKTRAEIKDKITEFNVRKEEERLREESRQCELAKEFQLIHDNELKKGKERTMFREKLLITRKEEMAAIASKLEEEERKKERQLEALRQLVRVEAPCDPYRAMKDTQSSRAKVLVHEQGEPLELQQPLFEIHSFTDQKILSDQRVKVSNALREAGLISTQYAQKVLSSIPPPKPTRRDQKSSIFKLK